MSEERVNTSEEPVDPILTDEQLNEIAGGEATVKHAESSVKQGM
jgi:hypothetical protein